tara:strand:- start:615 stop:1493 length:879 start_codon:yes stop_codon:yes gene_type:complete
MATNQQQQNKKEQEKNSSVLFQKIDLLSPSNKEDISTTEAKSNMSSTKNTKGNRQVVVATYTIQSIFEIPNGLDLEDKSVVENWGVKWNELIIQFVNGEEKEIDPTLDAREGDFKRPEDYEIVPAEDAGYKYDEEEEEEEKYECADCKKKYDNGELFVWDIENGNEENAEELMEDCELRTDYKRCEGCYDNFSGKVIEFLEKKEKNMEEEEEEEEKDENEKKNAWVNEVNELCVRFGVQNTLSYYEGVLARRRCMTEGCDNIKESVDDNLCHVCYHKSVIRGECWCECADCS